MNDKSDPSLRRLLIGGAMLTILPIGAFAQQATPFAADGTEAEAEIRRYAVELIVFEYSDGASGTKESFLPDVPEAATGADPFASGRARPFGLDDGNDDDVNGPPVADEIDELAVATPMSARQEELTEIVTYERIQLEVLPPEAYQLDAVYERLERLDAYRPLMRAAWIQPTLPEDATRPIKLRILGNPPLRLDGTVTLYLNRFLHLVMDLSLEEKTPYRGGTEFRRGGAFGNDEIRAPFSFGSRSTITPSIYYRIQEDRIVRNGELRYYDHPKFGVIAKITRVEENKTPPVGDDTADLLPGS